MASFLVVLRKQKQEEEGSKSTRKLNIFSGHINSNSLHGTCGDGLLCEQLPGTMLHFVRFPMNISSCGHPHVSSPLYNLWHIHLRKLKNLKTAFLLSYLKCHTCVYVMYTHTLGLAQIHFVCICMILQSCNFLLDLIDSFIYLNIKQWFLSFILCFLEFFPVTARVSHVLRLSSRLSFSIFSQYTDAVPGLRETWDPIASVKTYYLQSAGVKSKSAQSPQQSPEVSK